jgi:endonuclease-3
VHGPLKYGAAASAANDESARFATLTALLLSSRTNDNALGTAMARLDGACAPLGGLGASAVARLPEDVLRRALDGVAFPERKSGALLALAEAVHETGGTPPPDDVAAIAALPGIGSKGSLLYAHAFSGEARGVAVDSSLHRIAGRLGWVRSAKSAEQTRRQLEKWLPREAWGGMYVTFAGFGQLVCTESAPRCGECALHLEGICPWAANRGSRDSVTM